MVNITVFTPTYNRRNLLQRLYDSLLTQDYKDFEWLIVDDGSTDGTKELINSFENEGKILIRYFFKDNGGKHTAMNLGIKKADGRIFLIVDSDDYLCDKALSVVNNWDKSIKEKRNFAGVAGIKVFPDGTPIGGSWNNSREYIDATNLERNKHKLLGDKAEAYYTDVLRLFYPIPVFDNEKCVMEAVLWNRIANAGYKIRWFNEPLCVCEYLEGGMTQNSQKLYIKNFEGFKIWKKELIDMQPNLKRRIAEMGPYIAIARKKGMNTRDIASSIDRKNIEVHLASIYYGLHLLKMKARRKRN